MSAADDWPALERLVEWHIASGCAGIFSPCLSSEMFQLSAEERLALAQRVHSQAAGRCAVLATGTYGGTVEEMANTAKENPKQGEDNRKANEDANEVAHAAQGALPVATVRAAAAAGSWRRSCGHQGTGDIGTACHHPCARSYCTSSRARSPLSRSRTKQAGDRSHFYQR